MAIDFTSIIRGQRAARQDNNADLAARRAEEKFAFERDQRMIGLETQQWDRQAASYAAPLLGNMQAAADAGQDDVTFLINQRNVVRADPAFQAFAPEVQQRVLSQLGQAAQLTAQQRIAAGDNTAARKLLQSWGQQGSIPLVDVAGETGDITQIVKAADPTGALLKPNADGTYAYNGVNIPAAELAVALQGSGIKGLPALAVQVQAAQTQAAQLTAQQQQYQQMLYQQSAIGAGYNLPQPDGTFANATGQIYPRPPGMTGVTPAAATPAAGAAGVVAALGAGATSAPVAAPATPAGPGLPASLALPAAPAPPVVPVLPTAASPGASATMKSLQDYYTQAATAEQALPALQKTKQDLEAYINSVTDLVPAPGFGPGGAAGVGNTRLIRQPKPGTDPARYRAAVTQLGDVTAKVQENQIALKMARDNGIPAELQKMQGFTPADYGQELMKVIVEAVRTPEAAKATVKTSPVAASSYLNALTARLTQLQGQPGTEVEAGALIEARANLKAALDEARPGAKGKGGGGR